MKKLNVFDPNDLKEFEPDAKVGLIATVSEGELPHITLITALQARSTTELIWGQFSEGMSKRNVRKNPRVGFLIMSLSKELWRGKAVWKKALNEGDEYIMFNKKPMWRYNSYFGLHTVHYMDLVETTGREKLPMGGIVRGALMTKCAKAGASSGEQARILKPFAEDLFNDIGALKFISYIGSDGYPVIIPAIQCQAADSRRLAFAPTAYREELAAIPAGTTVAVFGLSLTMEDVLVRGTFRGFSRHRGVKLGTVDIDWVYNSMPPKQGQIYPEIEMRPVVNF
ncbi:MAG TPA: pyridoxamine 5'-phosphate oxidase family protein [Spirochaetota bacterium]|nr:pyridoxamine 5'-phosphate oxidase family protein [Spirochaetota bacterium]HPU86855.1 pyridoxamine 5'-phosphate oxidase family protein [Spirochaetota bacterium]